MSLPAADTPTVVIYGDPTGTGTEVVIDLRGS